MLGFGHIDELAANAERSALQVQALTGLSHTEAHELIVSVIDRFGKPSPFEFGAMEAASWIKQDVSVGYCKARVRGVAL